MRPLHITVNANTLTFKHSHAIASYTDIVFRPVYCMTGTQCTHPFPAYYPSLAGNKLPRYSPLFTFQAFSLKIQETKLVGHQ